MGFDVRLIPSANLDLQRGIEYYLPFSKNLASKFLDEFYLILKQLEENPFFQIQLEPVRTIKLKHFPYIVHFIVDEISHKVIIIAIVFGKQKKTNFSERIPK